MGAFKWNPLRVFWAECSLPWPKLRPWRGTHALKVQRSKGVWSGTEFETAETQKMFRREINAVCKTVCLSETGASTCLEGRVVVNAQGCDWKCRTSVAQANRCRFLWSWRNLHSFILSLLLVCLFLLIVPSPSSFILLSLYVVRVSLLFIVIFLFSFRLFLIAICFSPSFVSFYWFCSLLFLPLIFCFLLYLSFLSPPCFFLFIFSLFLCHFRFVSSLFLPLLLSIFIIIILFLLLSLLFIALSASIPFLSCCLLTPPSPSSFSLLHVVFSHSYPRKLRFVRADAEESPTI